VTNKVALEGVELLSKTEGIIPALETAHAVGYLPQLTKTLNSESILILNVSGRGDKDMAIISEKLNFFDE